jgi:DNA-directed RNA polymerase subunit beta'
MFLYPDHAKVPAAVQERLDNFTKAIKEANNTKQAMQKCKAALETYILPKGVKLTAALTKSEIGSLITRIADSVANDIDFMWDYWLLLNAGFLVSTQFPSSLDNKSFDIPKKFKIERDQFVKAFNDGKITIVQLDKAFTNLTKDIVKDFKERGVTVSDILDSGAAGTIDSIRQMVVGLGITINAKKEVIDVIGNSLSEGQTQTEYFHQASHAIQALYAKSSDTAIPGYAGRKLSTIMEHIKLSATKDCGSTNGLKLKVKDKTFMWAIVGKYQIVPKTVINRAGIKLITDADNLIGKSVLLRSPLYCKAKDGICETCLNKQWVDKLHLSAGANIGLMSSTYITGVMTTLTLKKSHTGILLGQQKINLLDEIDSIYE